MADPTLVNGQITDAVTQTNVKVLGEAPSHSLAMVYETFAQAAGIGMQNAVSSQHQMTTLGQTSTAQGINLLYSMDPAAATTSSLALLTGNQLAQALSELQAAIATNQQLAKEVATAVESITIRLEPPPIR